MIGSSPMNTTRQWSCVATAAASTGPTMPGTTHAVASSANICGRSRSGMRPTDRHVRDGRDRTGAEALDEPADDEHRHRRREAADHEADGEQCRGPATNGTIRPEPVDQPADDGDAEE